jgi:hypothetical protein
MKNIKSGEPDHIVGNFWKFKKVKLIDLFFKKGMYDRIYFLIFFSQNGDNSPKNITESVSSKG